MTEKKKELKELKVQYKEQKRLIKQKYSKDPLTKEQKYQEKLRQKEINDSMPKRYTMGEEIFNSVSHGVGAGLAVAAIVLLIVKAAVVLPPQEKPVYITSFAVYGFTLLLLYIMSTLYHALTPYNVKNCFAIFDHASIYILIAGTYTPYCLTAMSTVTGWVMFGIVWGLCIFGVTMYSVFGNRMRLISAITYLPMGCLVFFAFGQLQNNLSPMSMLFFLIGGAFYIVGWPFYALKKIKWMHCIFHLFVLAGSIFHFFSILLMVK